MSCISVGTQAVLAILKRYAGILSILAEIHKDTIGLAKSNQFSGSLGTRPTSFKIYVGSDLPPI